MKLLIPTLLVSLWCLPSVQASEPANQPRTMFGVEGYVQAWLMNSDSIDQVAVEYGFPFCLIAPLGERGQLRAMGAGAGYAAISTRDVIEGDSVSLFSGATNLRVEGDWSLSSKVLVGLNVGLPTGRTKLDEEDLRALALFLRPELGSRQPRPGSGLDLGAQVATAIPWGERLVLGGSMGYQIRGTYTAHESEAKVNPGDELLISGAADYAFGGASLRAAAIFTNYGKEQVGDQTHFRAGNKMEWKLAGATGIRATVISASLRHIRRGANHIGANLDLEPENSNGPYTLVRLGADLPASQNFHLIPSLQGRWMGENGYGSGAASVYGGGAEFALTSPRLEFHVYANVFTGSLDDGNIDVSGLGTGLRLAFYL